MQGEDAREQTGPVRVCLLGGFRVERDGETVPDAAWNRRQARTLVKILAATPAHRLHREQLIELLWPDEQPASIDSTLRKLLTFARHALDPAGSLPAVLELRDDSVALATQQIWIDVDAFEQSARTALADPSVDGLEAAARAYGGDLLPEDLYADWAGARREELRALQHDVQLTLAGLLGAGGERERAAIWLRQLLVADPTDEPAHRELMRLYALDGNRTAALQQYRTLQEVLAEQLGVAPEAETERLARRIEAGIGFAVPALPPAAQARSQTPLVGRGRALQLLQEQVAFRAQRRSGDAAGGGPRVILVSGEAGVGKTRLAVEAAQEASRRGVAVLWGTGYRPVGYAPFVEALDHYVAVLPEAERERLAADHLELTLLLPSLEPPVGMQDAGGGGDRTRLFAAVARFLNQIAAERSALLILDDLHVADAGSLELLTYLSRLAGQRNWLILGTYREGDVTPELEAAAAELRRTGRSRRLELLPLGRRECSQLVELVLRGEADETVRERVFETTLGNPLFVVELTGSLQAEGRLRQVTDAGWSFAGTSQDMPVPGQVDALIAQRVRALGEVAWRVLAIAAVTGMEAPRTVLQLAARQGGQPREDVVTGLEHAVAARILGEQESDYAFSHPLFRETIYRQLSSARREQLHELVARAIEQAEPEDVEALAYHWSRTQDDDKAVVFLEQAADRAKSAYANVQAESHYRALIDRLMRLDRPADLARAWRKLGKVLVDLSRYEEALEPLNSAMSLYRQLGDANGLAYPASNSGVAYVNLGRASEAQSLIQEVLRHAESFTPLLQARLRTVLALAYNVGGEYSRALEQARLAEEAARQVEGQEGDSARGGALSQQARALLMLGQLDASHQVGVRAVEAAEQAGDLAELGNTLTNLGGTAWLLGDAEQSRDCLERARVASEKLGNETWAAISEAGVGRAELFLGNWKEAAIVIDEAIARLRELGAPAYTTAYALLYRALLSLGEGKLDEVAALAGEALEIGQRTSSPDVIAQALIFLARADVQRGRPDQAVSLLDSLLPKAWATASGEATAGFMDAGFILACAGWAYQQAGNPGEAERASVAAVRLERKLGSPLLLEEALYHRALVLLAQQRHDEAAAALEEGLQLARRMRCVWREASMLEAQGQLAAARGDDPASRDLLGQARAIVARLTTPEPSAEPELTPAVPAS